jgi:TP901 family phage tail tape measure protein
MNDVGFRLFATDDVSGPAGRARSSLLSLGSSASTVSGGLGKIGSGALTAAKNLAMLGVPVALALGGIAVASTNAARQFQSDMALIQTQAGASADEVTAMSAAVLKLAPQTGTGPDELAAGLYHVESAGMRGAKALDILKVAAEGAKVGGADLESTTNALIAAQQSGVKGVEDMAGAMGTLNAIVGAGNMRMQDLTDAMGTGVLSTAKNYGVSIQSVGSALASMTDQGIPAVDAATRLSSAMRLMAAPTTKAAAELKSIGLSSTQLANDMRGPGGIDTAIHDLKDHLDKSGLSLTQQAALIAAAFGGKQSGAILTLIGNVGLLDQKVAAVNKGAGDFGAAWQATGKTVAEQQAEVGASLDSLKIQLGTELLPVEQRVLTGLTTLFSSPAVQQGIVDFGKGINDLFSADNIAGAEKFVQDVIPGIEDFAKTALPPFIAGLKVAGQITKEAFDLFNQLPEPLKAAIIGGLAVNKLSGGLISSGVMDIIKAAGSTAAGGGGGVGSLLGVQKVFVVNMAEGGMGPGGVVSPLTPAEEVAPTGLAAIVPALLPAALIVAASVGVISLLQGQFDPTGGNRAKVDQTALQAAAAGKYLTGAQRNDLASLGIRGSSDQMSAEAKAYLKQIADNTLPANIAITSARRNASDTSDLNLIRTIDTNTGALRGMRDILTPAIDENSRALRGMRDLKPPPVVVPAPVVNVTVSTTVSAKDVTTGQAARVWYGTIRPV